MKILSRIFQENRYLRAVFHALILMSVAACSLGSDDNLPHVGGASDAFGELSSRGFVVTAEVLSNWENTVQAQVQSCQECHGSGGSQKQLILGTTERTLSELWNYIDFQRASASRLVSRTKDGHCDAQPKCLTDGSEMISAIENFYQTSVLPQIGEEETVVTEDNTDPSGSLETERTLLFANLPTEDQWLELSFHLASINPNMAGSFFRVEIQEFDESSYRFRKPRIDTRFGGHIYVRGVRLLINGVYSVANSQYDSVEKLVESGQAPVLSSAKMIALVDKGKLLDRISFEFSEIAPAASPDCKDVTLFLSNVYRPFMSQSNADNNQGGDRCLNCHGNTTHAAFQKFPMKNLDGSDLTPEQLCRRALQRLDFSAPANSPLLAYPRSQSNDHPIQAIDNQTEVDQILAWIQAETN